MKLDQAETVALFEYCHGMGWADLFHPSFAKLWGLLAEDRDWTSGELSCANRYAETALKPQCPMSCKVVPVSELARCVRGACPWKPCHLRNVLRG